MQLLEPGHDPSLLWRLQRLLLTVAVTIGCFGLDESVGAALESVSEYAVKAAYLYNFAKFVEWPLQAFKTATSPLILCIVGKDPFGDALDAVVNKTVRERTLVVQRLPRVEKNTGCHILFLSNSESNHLAQVLRGLENAPVLTVSDIQGFAEAGGMIGLINVEQHIRFEINISSVQKANLKISSQLLKLAKIIGNSE
jgi:hypothetical protein